MKLVMLRQQSCLEYLKHGISMNKLIDIKLSKWLQILSKKWSMPYDRVANYIWRDEIDNRLRFYPLVSRSLTPFDYSNFKRSILSCWALTEQHQAIRLNRFLGDPINVERMISGFITDFPDKDSCVVDRIDNFIADLITMGFRAPRYSDYSGAALFTSVLLTSIYPKRFVDFRTAKWEAFAEYFKFELPPNFYDGYGRRIVWAGKRAQEIVNTTTYKFNWVDNNVLWPVGGICWAGLNPDPPTFLAGNIDGTTSYKEGNKKLRLHLYRERNQTVMSLAKAIKLIDDPLLRCEVCDFSFIEKYGEHGNEFIEGHHLIPLSLLKQNSYTKVEDIALLCSNCHSMIHHGEKVLTISRLQSLLN